MRFASATLILSLWACSAAAQVSISDWTFDRADNPELPPGFIQGEAKRADDTTMRFFVGDHAGDAPRPLMVYLAGSGAQSHFVRMGERVGYSVYGLIVNRFSDRYHVAATDKRGVEFGAQGQRGAGTGASEEYTKHATLEGRIAETRRLLDTLLAEANVDSEMVVLVGHSEGADVAAAVAAADDRVTHVVFLAGGGAAQWLDLLISTRRRMAGKSPEEIEVAIKDVEAQMRDVLEAPDADDKWFAGHAYRRWGSFASVASADNLRATDALVFAAHGTQDQAVPIESFDFLLVEMLRHGRDRFEALRYPGRDHSFIHVGDEPSNDPFLEVIEDALKWFETAEAEAVDSGGGLLR